VSSLPKKSEVKARSKLLQQNAGNLLTLRCNENLQGAWEAGLFLFALTFCNGDS